MRVMTSCATRIMSSSSSFRTSLIVCRFGLMFFFIILQCLISFISIYKCRKRSVDCITMFLPVGIQMKYKCHKIIKPFIAARKEQLPAQKQRLRDVYALLAKGLRRLHPVHCKRTECRSDGLESSCVKFHVIFFIGLRVFVILIITHNCKVL